MCPKSRGAAPLDECRDRSTVNFHTPHRRYFMCHHRRPTEANINKHMPSLWKKKKRKKKRKKSARIPQSSVAERQSPTRSWDLWAESEPIPGFFRDWAWKPHLWPSPSHPPGFVRADQRDWTFGLATGQFWFCVFFFGRMCFFFFFFHILICPLCALVCLYSPFSRDQILSVLHNSAHIRIMGSQILPCVFPKNWAQDSWHFLLLSSKSAHQPWWLITELYWGQHPDLLATWAHG